MQLAIGAASIRRYDVPVHPLRRVEGGHTHAERPEQRAVEVAIERRARNDFDDTTEDVDGKAVIPLRARGERQRQPCQAVRELGAGPVRLEQACSYSCMMAVLVIGLVME